MLKSEIKERIRLIHPNHMNQLIPSDLYTLHDLEQIGAESMMRPVRRASDAIKKGRGLVWECIDAVKGEK